WSKIHAKSAARPSRDAFGPQDGNHKHRKMATVPHEPLFERTRRGEGPVVQATEHLRRWADLILAAALRREIDAIRRRPMFVQDEPLDYFDDCWDLGGQIRNYSSEL